MVSRFYKHKVLLDEGFPPGIYFPRVNQRFDVKHVKNDLRKIGLPDEEVYELVEHFVNTYQVNLAFLDDETAVVMLICRRRAGQSTCHGLTKRSTSSNAKTADCHLQRQRLQAISSKQHRHGCYWCPRAHALRTY